MYSVCDTLAGGLPHSDIHGSTPARGSPWLFAACHVLHRLLVPRHPPNALLILDIPDPGPKAQASPCTETILRPRIEAKTPIWIRQGQPWKYLCFPHTTGSSRMATPQIARAIRNPIHPARSFTTPLNPRRPAIGALVPSKDSIPGQTHSRTTGPAIHPQTDLESHAPRDAPEPDSHFQRTTRPHISDRPTARPHIRDIVPRRTLTPNSNIRDTEIYQSGSASRPPT
jgi:hypothetical protein